MNHMLTIDYEDYMDRMYSDHEDELCVCHNCSEKETFQNLCFTNGKSDNVTYCDECMDEQKIYDEEDGNNTAYLKVHFSWREDKGSYSTLTKAINYKNMFPYAS